MNNKAHDKVTLTVQEIQIMKARGQPCPPDCGLDYWQSVQPPPGESITEIANMTRERFLKQAVEKHIRQSEMVLDTKGQIDALADLAVVATLDVLTSPTVKEQTKLDAAKFVVDHTIGKAKQEVEHSGSVALDLRAQADAFIREKALQARLVGENKPIDKYDEIVDAFLEEQVPDGFVVGKKELIDVEE